MCKRSLALLCSRSSTHPSRHIRAVFYPPIMVQSVADCTQLPLEDGQTVPLRKWWEVGSQHYDRRHSVLTAVSEAWELWGPFDAVAGFSEGGAVAHIVSIAAMNQSASADTSGMGAGVPWPSTSIFTSLKAAIFFSSYCPEGSPSFSPLPLPTLHFFSAVDAAVPPERSSALADLYSHASRHHHTDGHCVPTRSKDISALRDFLLQFHTDTRPPPPTGISQPVAYEIPPSQTEEQDALASIFDKDYTLVTANPVQCQITIGWHEVSSTVHAHLRPWISLLFTLNSQYLREPSGRPCLRLCTKERNMITVQQETSILNAATQAIISCGGEPAIFAAASAARDWVDSQFPNGPTSASFQHSPQCSLIAADRAADEHSWWEVEDINMADVFAAGSAAGSVSLSTASRAAVGREAGNSSFHHEWKLVVGLVGKPSSGKSTFFNAACRPSNLDSAARMAAHPFTTIEPNIGQAFAALACPCVSADMLHKCSPLYGHGELPGTRRVPVVLKDVAGLVPGAYQGKGRGNAFLNDLVNCDVLIHVVDASGQTTASGVEGEGDPRHDIDWVVSECLRAPSVTFCFFTIMTFPLPNIR